MSERAWGVDTVGVLVRPTRDDGQGAQPGRLEPVRFEFLTRDDGQTWEVHLHLPGGQGRVVGFRLGDLDRALAVPGSSTR